MKKLLAIFIAAALALAVSACGAPAAEESSAPPPTAAPTPEASAAPSAAPAPETPVPETPVPVSRLTEETDELIVSAIFPEALEGLEYSEADLEAEGDGILIRAKEPLTDMRFFLVEVTYPYTGGEDYIPGDTLNSYDEVTVTKPVIVHVTRETEHPLFGFSYTDAEGEEHSYILSRSGLAPDEGAPYHIEAFTLPEDRQ